MRSFPGPHALRPVNDDLNTHSTGDPLDKRSKTVRVLNTQLRHIIELESHDEDFLFHFFCECGCYEPAELTVAEYDALADTTIYREGHAPLERRYGVTIHPGHKPAA